MSITETAHEAEAVHLPVVKIRAGDNPRKTVDDESQAALTDSVRQLGVITPITVRRSEDGEGWTLIAGQRRLMAALSVGLETIPALVVYEEDEDRRKAIAVVENLHRDPLKPMEEARAFQEASATMAPAQIAAAYSISEQTVRDRIGLLSLPESLHELIDSGVIPLGATRVLAKITEHDEKLGEACAYAIATEKVGIGQFASSPNWALQNAVRMWNAENTEDFLLLFPATASEINVDETGWGQDLVDEVAADAATVHDAYEWSPVLPEEAIIQARAYGSLLEISTSDGQDYQYITDPEWLFEHGKKALAEKAERLRKAPNTVTRSSTKKVKKADMTDEQREEHDRKRQEEAEAKHNAISDNEALGAKLLGKLQPKLDKRTMYLIARVLGEKWADAIGKGCRYTVPELRTVTERKAGGVHVEYASAVDGYDWWEKRLKRLKTPEEIVHHLLFGLAAAQFCDENAVAQSHRTWASPPGTVGDGEIAKLLLQITRAAVPARMKEREEARIKDTDDFLEGETPADEGGFDDEED